MGRPGRYTLSVMAWVAAYAGWSSIIGLVVAAITGDEAREVSAGWSALLTVVGPLVPTLVALWFNDWARDGFPTREQLRARRGAGTPVPAAAAAATAGPAEVVANATNPNRQVVAGATVARATTSEAAEAAEAAGGAAGAMVADATTTVAAHPLGVPARAAGARRAVAAAEGGFPVAPLVRD